MLVAALAVPALAGGQSANEVGAYFGISRTPVGALAPILTNTLIDRLQNGASLALRYGNLARGDFNAANHAFGVTAILPAGLGSTLQLTAGVNAADCLGCDPELMAGIGGDIRILGSAMGTTPSSALWTVSLDGELGYANLDPGSAMSGYVGLPIALVQRGQGMQFVPFITPAFAFAQTSGQSLLGSRSGSALMLGGGLAIYNTDSGLLVNVGAQHSFMNGARNTIGLNVVIGGK
jgi:hypothetical protein